LFMSSVWMRLANGREELIIHPDHVKRLLDDGGVIIPDPRTPVEQVKIDNPVEIEATSEAVEPAQDGSETASETPTVRKRGRQARQQ